MLALEIMILMMETPTDDSVEVSIAFLKECGQKLLEVCFQLPGPLAIRLPLFLGFTSSP